MYYLEREGEKLVKHLTSKCDVGPQDPGRPGCVCSPSAGKEETERFLLASQCRLMISEPMRDPISKESDSILEGDP